MLGSVHKVGPRERVCAGWGDTAGTLQAVGGQCQGLEVRGVTRVDREAAPEAGRRTLGTQCSRCGHQAVSRRTEDPGGLRNKGGGQGGGGWSGLPVPPGWGRRRGRGGVGGARTQRAHAAPAPGPAPTRPCRRLPHLGRPSRRRQGALVGGQGGPQSHGAATSAGADELQGAPAAGGRRSAGGGVPPPRPRPRPGRGAPPRPRHLGNALLRGRGEDGVARNRSPPISSPPRGPSVAPLHFRRGTPTSHGPPHTSHARSLQPSRAEALAAGEVPR